MFATEGGRVMHGLRKSSKVIMCKGKSLLVCSTVVASLWLSASINAFGQQAQHVVQPVIAAIDRGVAVPVQLHPQLKPKPGYIVGRIVDNQGRPLLPIEIHVQGFPVGSPIEYYGNFEPTIDRRTGYYEIQVPNGAYRVSPRFKRQIRDSTSDYACLLVFEDFVTADGRKYQEQPYSESRRGIVSDFIWHPDPHFARLCSMFRR